MTRENYDIVGSFNRQRVLEVDAERSINCFEYIDENSKRKKTLLSTAGIRNQNIDFDGADGGFRQSFVFGDFQYHVIGDAVYRVDSLNVATQIFTITTVTGYVGIDANTFQIIFVDGSKGYIWDTTAGTVYPIIDSFFPTHPIDVCYLDGFFVVADGTTNNFQLSEFNNGLIWGGTSVNFTGDNVTNIITVPSNANFQTSTSVRLSLGVGGALPPELVVGVTYYVIRLSATTLQLAASYTDAINGIPIDFSVDPTPLVIMTSTGQLQQGSITSHPGTIVACRTLHRRLFLFSQNYTEVWENAGVGTNLPFRRNNSLLIEYGCAAIGSIATGFDRMFFLSQDTGGLGSVQMVVGAEAMPVSELAIDEDLASFAADPDRGVADAYSELIKIKGLIFYRLNFTNADHTYVYNVSMSQPGVPRWHEEEMLDGSRHVAQTHIFYNGNNYYGAYNSPTLYLTDNTLYTNDGEPIRRCRIGKPIGPNNMNRTRIDRFQVDLLQGDAALLNLQEEDINLLTEDGFVLLTEAGDPILVTPSTTIQEQIEDPKVYLAISKDGGVSYGNELLAPMGKLGQRSFRTVWRKLGTIPRGQIFIPRLQWFDPIPIVVLGASWDFEVMPE